ncbi:DUF2742 domain-containing protein [Actinomycetospora sp. CA-101289]|uniref:DUF2742 domain-containing protein n=1 Tax=Actinomycetospora sp. CA-101289 TaxID=3239893 RepID=UPI003D966D7E
MTPDADHLARVHAIVAPHMTGGPLPAAFTPAWLELDDDDPRRHTALVRSAFARWAEDADLGAPVPRVLVEISHAIAEHGVIPGVRAWGETRQSGEFRRMRAARDFEQRSRAS